MAKTKTQHWVEEKLHTLKALKDKHITLSQIKIWQDKVNMIETSAPRDENDFRTKVSATVKRQKDAELSANLPEYNFIAMSDEGEKNRKIVKESWKYHWLESNSDKQIGKVIKSATTNWSWISFEGIKNVYKEISEPYTEEGDDWLIELKFRKRIIERDWIESRLIPFANFYINWTDIDNATEAITIEYIDKDEYIKEKKLSPLYKNINRVKATSKNYVLNIDGDDIWTEDANVVTEITYWNEPLDKMVVIANWIEVLSTHIPYAHKKLPFLIYIDNDAENRIWWIGEFELLADDELAKNEYRSLTVKWVKASIGFLLKERGNDLEIETVDYWMTEVFETDDIDWIKHFAPWVPIQAISELEAKVDNDIIAKSWVDFKSLSLTPSESATKTASKSNSSKKRINLNIRDNGADFFRRLWELRLSNIQQLHTTKARRIPIEGWSITNKGVFVPDEKGTYGSSIIWANFIEGDFLVLPITETMLWNSAQRKKDNLSTFMQVTWNLTDDKWAPVVKGKQLTKLACTEYWYDYDKLTEESIESQSPDDIVNNVFAEGWTEWALASDPNYIPPAQRSGAWNQVQAISGQSKIDYNDE